MLCKIAHPEIIFLAHAVEGFISLESTLRGAGRRAVSTPYPAVITFSLKPFRTEFGRRMYIGFVALSVVLLLQFDPSIPMCLLWIISPDCLATPGTGPLGDTKN